MQLAFRLISTLIIFTFFTACQRPYALYQRTPGEVFRPETKPATARQVLSADTIPETIVVDIQPVDEETMEASVSVSPAIAIAPVRAAFGLKHGQRLLPEKPEIADQQPRPKARSNSNPPRKTFREWLGLRPRPKLNWWQRISWQIKASVFVILVAVVFAILNISTLAIIFGIIGAILLVIGLKKTFKVRRPWF